MKLKCISVTQGHLDQAIADGHEHEIAACRKELAELKREAMHPMEVLDSVQKYCLPSNCGNNLLEVKQSHHKDKHA